MKTEPNTIELETTPGNYTTCRVLRETTLKDGTLELLVLIPVDDLTEYVYVSPR